MSLSVMIMVVTVNLGTASQHMRDEQLDQGHSDGQSQDCVGISLLQRRATMIDHNKSAVQKAALHEIKEDISERGSQLPGNVFDKEPETYCTPQVLSRYPGGWPGTLDMGVYWFGKGGATAKALNSGKSEYYDPARKTVIHFHGSAPGVTRMCDRETGRCPADVCRDEVHPLLMERWLDDGWNVGFFYWDQFADEDCVRDVEQKIWFDRHGDGLHWKSHDVGSGLTTIQVYKDKASSLADLCADHLGKVMGFFSGSQVRFIGHSVGAQLAAGCAGVLHMRGMRAAPQRLTLLDPYFSNHFSEYTWILECKKLQTAQGTGEGDFAAIATTQCVERLWQKYNVITEIYKSSAITEYEMLGSINKPLEAMSVLVKYRPNFCGSFVPGNFGGEMLSEIDIIHLSCRHSAVLPLYFLSYGQPSSPVEPAIMVGGSELGLALSNCTTPSASCNDGQIREWVRRQLAVDGRQHWVQAAGSYSLGADDDTFELRPGLGEEADLDP